MTQYFLEVKFYEELIIVSENHLIEGKFLYRICENFELRVIIIWILDSIFYH